MLVAVACCDCNCSCLMFIFVQHTHKQKRNLVHCKWSNCSWKRFFWFFFFFSIFLSPIHIPLKNIGLEILIQTTTEKFRLYHDYIQKSCHFHAIRPSPTKFMLFSGFSGFSGSVDTLLFDSIAKFHAAENESVTILDKMKGELELRVSLNDHHIKILHFSVRTVTFSEWLGTEKKNHVPTAFDNIVSILDHKSERKRRKKLFRFEKQ